jgi:hypothetical protein
MISCERLLEFISILCRELSATDIDDLQLMLVRNLSEKVPGGHLGLSKYD